METADKLLILPLSGVDSEHCALIVDKGLDKLSGILAHRVELNNHRAVLTTKDPQEVLPRAVAAIRDLGYEVETLTRNFPVRGMQCASCAVSVESLIQAQPGVLKASVNYASASLQVEYIPTLTNPASFQKSLEAIGYALVVDQVPEEETAWEQEHFRLLRRRTIFAVAFSLPVLLLDMVFPHIPHAHLIMWALATPVMLFAGRQFFINAFKQARKRSANMDTLVALSTGIAYLFSVFNTLYPQFWSRRGLEAQVYFEAATVVIAFILLGKLLEERARVATSSAIKKLMGLQPKTVTVLHEGGHAQEIPLEKLRMGETVLVKPGEKIAVDGEILSGASFVDESMISGESIPVEKSKGSKVWAGTLNQKGSFQFQAQKLGKDTLLAHMIEMVAQAQGSKPPVQKRVDRISAIFVPIVMGLAVSAFFSWMIWGGQNGLTHGLLALVTVLVIACPCALGLATPTALMVGIGKGAEHGILIRDAEALEKARQVNAVVMDKTGTITQGKPLVTETWWSEENARNRDILFSLEQASEHPLATAITTYYRDQAQPLELTQIQSLTGAGIQGVYQGAVYLAGTLALMEQHEVALSPELLQWIRDRSSEAKTIVLFARSKTLISALAIADRIKPSSRQAIAQLEQAGIRVYMLTGDQQQTASAMAKEAGISHFQAGALPQDKFDFVKALQEKGMVVAMVGDGINDSQAMAQADVSIAMGRGSDIAMEVAGITLITSDLLRIPFALQLSAKTVRTIRQNLFWAFIYNLAGIPVAAGLLYPFTGFLLNPMMAGAAMALSSVSVVTNSLRLKWSKP